MQGTVEHLSHLVEGVAERALERHKGKQGGNDGLENADLLRKEHAERHANRNDDLHMSCEKFAQSRAREGENLKKDLIAKLDGMLELVGQIEERAPKIIAEYREKLEGKVKELLEDTQIDEGRIASEIVIFADKICTDEEVVRLRSHVEHMKATLQSDDSGIGRKLDFIAQEMNREANTILSKANDLETSNIGIELKTEIEKVREQIQNIE